MKRILTLILLCFLVFIPAQAQTEPLRVVATTTIIADVARNIGGDLVEVVSIVPPDTDIHAFQPVPQDVALIAQADLVLVNGAGLETFLGGLVENVAEVELVVVSNGVEILAFGGHGHDHDEDDDHGHDEDDNHTDDEDGNHHHMRGERIGVLGQDADCGDDDDDHAHEDDDHHDHDHGDCDPHVWTDPRNVMIWADNIADAFASADPANADTYRANAEAYRAQLVALDAEIEATLSVIPPEARVLVTNHEFLAYFADRYGFEVVATVIPGISTLAEPSPQEVAALIDLIQDEGVSAIFAEVSDPGRLAQVIAADAGEIAVVTLYSDSLSGPDGPAATYIDYLRHNAQAIASALAG
jgi:zinc/manganese transport system substrate-binding protein